MKLDAPSFLLGAGAGACTVLFSKQLRPLLLEVATFLYRFTDTVMARASMNQADLQHLLAEARARAHFFSPYREPAPKRERNMPTRSSSST